MSTLILPLNGLLICAPLAAPRFRQQRTRAGTARQSPITAHRASPRTGEQRQGRAAAPHRALRGPSSAVLGAFEGETLVGTSMVGHDGHRGWVYYLAVTREAQGEGRGRALMAACEAWLRERDIPKLNLMVRSSNAEPQAFDDALGYAVDDVCVRSKRLT